MLCSNLEGASLVGCNFDDPAGSNAIMEGSSVENWMSEEHFIQRFSLSGVNLRGAVLEGSNMARVNLRVATIKHGNLKNCDLRAAVLAGADLEVILSGAEVKIGQFWINEIQSQFTVLQPVRERPGRGQPPRRQPEGHHPGADADAAAHVTDHSVTHRRRRRRRRRKQQSQQSIVREIMLAREKVIPRNFLKFLLCFPEHSKQKYTV